MKKVRTVPTKPVQSMPVEKVFSATETKYSLAFGPRDANLGKALEENHLRARYQKLDPVPKDLAEYIAKIKSPVGRPIDLQRNLWKISTGMSVEALKGSIGRARAIEKVAQMSALQPEQVAKAHSFFMRLAAIKPGRGTPRKK